MTCPLHNWVIDLDTARRAAPDDGCVTALPVRGRGRPRAALHRRRCRVSDGGASGPPAPIAASAAGSLAAGGRRRCRGRPGASGQPRPAVLEGRGAGRDAGHRRPAAAPDDRRPTRVLGYGARPRRRRASATPSREHGPDCVAFYVSGQLPDRGLLRRQQADEGLHRQRQHRHQLAPLHGVRGRRPQARLRRGRGARRATTTWSRPTSSSSSAATLAWCHPVLYQRMQAARGDARHARSSSSTRAAPRPPTAPTCICRSRPGTDVALFNGLLAHLAGIGRRRSGLGRGARQRLRGDARPRRARRRRPGTRRRRLPASRPTTSRASTRCSPRPNARVTVYSARA